ncbi:MAG: hypothetical protein ACJ75T_07945 [Solirubrobacterales bacterium]
MKVGTLLGEYPFEYRRFERRSDGVALVGLVAGLEASVVFTSDDLARASKWLAPLFASGALVVLCRGIKRRGLS